MNTNMNKTQCTGCWTDCEGVPAGSVSGASSASSSSASAGAGAVGGVKQQPHCKRMLVGGVSKFECCETRAAGGWSDLPSSQLLALWERNGHRATQLSFCSGSLTYLLTSSSLLSFISLRLIHSIC